jgi:hypothetical protein
MCSSFVGGEGFWNLLLPFCCKAELGCGTVYSTDLARKAQVHFCHTNMHIHLLSYMMYI